MRPIVRWLGLAVALLALGGCKATEAEVKPKYQPEEFVLPPEDPRYSRNVEYPKETLFQDVIKKENPGQRDPFKTNQPAGFGGGPGMRPGM